MDIIGWLCDNINWIFSGIGVLLITVIFNLVNRAKNRKNDIVTLIKVREDGKRTFIIEWDRKHKTAEEYRPANPKCRWKANVTLDDDTLTIVVPWSNEDPLVKDDRSSYPMTLIAKKKIPPEGGVCFTGTEKNSSDNSSKFTVYSLTGFKE